MKRWLVICWLGILAVCIGSFFWYYEWKYSLPTPVPANYVAVNTGSYVDVSFAPHSFQHKPLFLHFFNPDCPCSKFNIPQFEALVEHYSEKANFAIVIMSSKHFTQAQIQRKFNLNIPVFFDSAIAARCGVYSTPQAVIIDEDNRLFYRGNYNRSRYCTDEKTGFAQIALDSLLHHNTSLIFSSYALKAYGCELPKCTR